MIEKLRRWILAEMDLPTEPPRGYGEKPPILVRQPDRRAHHLKFGLWTIPQILAFSYLVAASLSWQPDFLPEIVQVVIALGSDLTAWIPGLELIGGTWIAVLTWLLFLAEFTYGLAFYLLGLGPRTKWYFIDDRGIGSREGFWTQREKYTTWRNIQTFNLKQNPIQTVLGLADIAVRVAGADKEKDDTPKRAIVFRDIRDAKAVYDDLVTRLEEAPEEPVPSDPEALSPARVAAVALVEAARALRNELESGGLSATRAHRP